MNASMVLMHDKIKVKSETQQNGRVLALLLQRTYGFQEAVISCDHDRPLCLKPPKCVDRELSSPVVAHQGTRHDLCAPKSSWAGTAATFNVLSITRAMSHKRSI
jgi:hypothetical protein